MKREKITKEQFVVEVERAKEIMYHLAFGILENVSDTEDAVAEAVMIAWERRDQVRETEKFQKWMMQIVVNISRDRASKRKRIQLPGDDKLSRYIREESQKEEGIWTVVLTMEKKYRTILLLYYYAGYSVAETAELLHIPEGTVKSRLSRARDKLKQIITESQ